MGHCVVDAARESDAAAAAKVRKASEARPAHVDNVPAELIERIGAGTGTTVLVGWDRPARALLTVTGVVRPSCCSALAALTRAGLTAYVLTGDNERTGRPAATEVGSRSTG